MYQCPVLQQQQEVRFFHSSLATAEKEKENDTATADDGSDSKSQEQIDDQAECATAETTTTTVVYESPLATVVTRLRAVSLLSALTGSVGLPTFCILKGTMPPGGLIAFGATFTIGSVASTAAIHFVFSPYVYQIEKIVAVEEEEEDSPQTPEAPVLLRAISKSLFLTRIETVFDPENNPDDIIPYKGFRPLCNFVVREKPLYVHPEYVYSAALRKQLHVKSAEDYYMEEEEGKQHQKPPTTRENPDDFL